MNVTEQSAGSALSLEVVPLKGGRSTVAESVKKIGVTEQTYS